MTHQPGVYVPLRALFLVFVVSLNGITEAHIVWRAFILDVILIQNMVNVFLIAQTWCFTPSR